MANNISVIYLVGDIIPLTIWIMLFYFQNSFRKYILFFSVIATPLALTGLLFTRDYWRPSFIFGNIIGPEDFIFAFAIGGISVALIKLVWQRINLPEKFQIDYWWIVAFYVIVATVMIGGNILLGFNSMDAAIVGMLLVGMSMIVFRPKLLFPSLINGIVLFILALISYQVFLLFYPQTVVTWWMISNLTGVFIWGIPIEEILFYFAWGFLVLPLSSLIFHLQYKQVNSPQRKT